MTWSQSEWIKRLEAYYANIVVLGLHAPLFEKFDFKFLGRRLNQKRARGCECGRYTTGLVEVDGYWLCGASCLHRARTNR